MSRTNLIIGRQPVLEALKEGKEIERIFMLRNAVGEIVNEIRELANRSQIPINIVPAEKLNSLSRAQHQGIIALAGMVTYMDLQQVLNHIVSKGEIPLLVMLDGVTDVRNIGAIARSAWCCGAQAIIIPDKGVGALNEDAIKSSAGALQMIAVCRVGSLLKAVDSLHLNGIPVFTSEMKAEKMVTEMDWRAPACIVMGSEDKGVQPYMTKAADAHFHIPMAGKFDSFNVSVAAGIILYEAMKQRMGISG